MVAWSVTVGEQGEQHEIPFASSESVRSLEQMFDIQRRTITR